MDLLAILYHLAILGITAIGAWFLAGLHPFFAWLIFFTLVVWPILGAHHEFNKQQNNKK